MARHNRDGHGSDQRGFEYGLSYQPDWLRLVKVTRNLESGRQSTKTLFRNPAPSREGAPGPRVRTRVASEDQQIDFEIAITDPHGIVRRIIVETVPPGGSEADMVSFSFDGGLPEP